MCLYGWREGHPSLYAIVPNHLMNIMIITYNFVDIIYACAALFPG